MNNRRFTTQTGASVIEMLIVLTVAAILTVVAVAQFGKSGKNLERQNISRQFKVSLERARFDSVKRRAAVCSDQSRVEILSPTSYRLITDQNRNGTIDLAAETQTVDFAGRTNVAIVNTFTYPVTIRFDHRGNVSSGDCGSEVGTAPSVTFCNTPCTMATANAANADIVFVSPTGTAGMMHGGESLPTFAPPAVTSIGSGSDVNPMLTVWDAPASPTPSPTGSPSGTATPSPSSTPTATPTSTPTATPTPTPTGTPTPTPTPTATPTPTPTPTPSPTPFACLSGQRPSQTGCTCYSPKIVRANGKCM